MITLNRNAIRHFEIYFKKFILFKGFLNRRVLFKFAVLFCLLFAIGTLRHSLTAPQRKARILCWLATTPKNRIKLKHIKTTWGQRCDTFLAFSSFKDISGQTIKLPVADGRKFLWGKTRLALKYIHDHYLEHFDWVYKADDDTYVVVENLRSVLEEYDPKMALYLGYHLKEPKKNISFMSGGAGYVLSKAAVKRFVGRAFPDPVICSAGPAGSEDVELASCLAKVNVTALDVRDSAGRPRFLPARLTEHFTSSKDLGKNFWLRSFSKQPIKTGSADCCSEAAISFHYVSPQEMLIIDYFVYKLRKN